MKGLGYSSRLRVKMLELLLPGKEEVPLAPLSSRDGAQAEHQVCVKLLKQGTGGAEGRAESDLPHDLVFSVGHFSHPLCPEHSDTPYVGVLLYSDGIPISLRAREEPSS